MVKKIKVEREIDADSDRLFSDIDTTIKYLQEIRGKYGNIDFEEKWCGYEDNYFCFTYLGEETDEEYKERLSRIRLEEKIAKRELKKRELEAKKRAEIAAIHEKYRDL